MKRKVPAKHKVEDIKRAVARIQAGEPLSKVAQEFGVSKSLASYWVERADRYELAPSATTSPSPKTALRTRKFIEDCASTISLAFARLKAELRKDSPKGVKDLSLAVAVLFDKMTQAAQRLEAQAPRAAQDWSASESTLLILRQHREGVSSPTPGNISGAVSLEAAPVEHEKKAGSDAPIAGEVVPSESGQAQPRRDGAA